MNYPVSIKGLICKEGRILFLKNRRQELELPGGRIELFEIPEVCLLREIKEETTLDVNVLGYVGAGLFEVIPNQHVFIVAFHCEIKQGVVCMSEEHTGYCWVPYKQLSDFNIPPFYLRLALLLQEV